MVWTYTVRSASPRSPSSRESRSEHVEALWKRQTAADRSSYGGIIARGAALATGGSKPQLLLAPYTQEVARSSRAPPIVCPRAQLGLEVRSGHTGKCDGSTTTSGGIAVHIAARVNALAGAGEVLL